MSDSGGISMADESRADKWRLIRGTGLKSEDRHCLLTLFLIQGDNDAAFCRQETLADEIGVHPRSVRRSLQRLNAAGIVHSDWQIRSGVPMRHYAIDFDKLKSVQRGNGRTPASYPETADGRTPVSEAAGHLRPKPQDTSVLQERSIEHPLKIKSERTPKTKFQKPTVEQVQAYAAEQSQPDFDAGKFYDHYESNGWRVGGKGPMKCWRASVRQWIRTGGTKNGGKPSGSAVAERAWQAVLDSLQRRSRFKPDEIMGDIGERAWQALRPIGLKRLDEANDFERRELRAKFIQAFSEQQGAA